MSRSNPFKAMVTSLTTDEFALLSSAVSERRCKEEVGFGNFAEAATFFRPNPCCPICGAPSPFKDGWSTSGIQRYRCQECGLRFNSLTNTILEYSKKDLATWVEFVRLMRYNVPIDAVAEICRITHQTAFEWRHRVFATVNGYQDRLVLKERIWIDETYINDTELSRGYGEARKRGLSKQKICIAVAIDIFKNPVAVVCGHGKPSAKRIKDGLISHIAPGSVVVHDMEKSHGSLIRAANCTDEAYRADIRDSTYLECMAMVNNLCSWIKRYLWRFTGMEPTNLQSYLNWYVYLFRVNQAGVKWPETERVVRHLLRTDASFRSKT